MSNSSNSGGWLFAASAKGIQGYVLCGDKVREMAGASELVEQFPNRFLDVVLDHLGHQKEPNGNRNGCRVLTQAAGGLRLLFNSEAGARRLALLLPIMLTSFAPGLEIVCAVVPADSKLGTALHRLEEQLAHHRNEPMPFLPPAGPLVARNPRSSLPAITANKRDGLLDAEMARMRAMTGPVMAHAHFGVLERTLPDKAKVPAYLRQFDQLADDDKNYIAVLHADVNGLGQAIDQLRPELDARPWEEALTLYARFSAATREATEAAARQAVQGHLQRQLRLARQRGESEATADAFAFRPLICAGEDFTAVMCAEGAAEFTCDYLIALETETRKRLGPLALGSLTDGLTACAGLAFCKPHHPFRHAYAIAESLCAHAKKESGRACSALAFMRLKGSLTVSDQYPNIVRAAFTNGNHLLTMNPYHVGSRGRHGLPTFAQLQQLAQTLDRLPRGQVREFVRRAYDSPEAATLAHERLEMLTEQRGLRNTLDSWRESLHALTGGGLWQRQGDSFRTPLYDALELHGFAIHSAPEPS